MSPDLSVAGRLNVLWLQHHRHCPRRRDCEEDQRRVLHKTQRCWYVRILGSSSLPRPRTLAYIWLILDIHYIEFLRDVNGFEILLDRFKQAFSEYGRVRQIQLGLRDYHNDTDRTRREKKEQKDQVGGFEDTVEQCEKLLTENGKYLTKRANGWDNAKWHIFGGQERADKLRARLQFHSTKIGVFMQTISVSVQAATLNALGDIQREIEKLPLRVLHEILRGLSGQPKLGGLRPIPPELHKRYMAALERDKPEAFIDVSCFPLKEGLDALAAALDQSTTKFHSSALGIWKPSIHQLHSLMKARWIFDRMRDSSQLREAGQDSLWRYCLENVQVQIKTEYGKYEHFLVEVEADIASLDLESFRIWMPPSENVSVSITEADESQQEEKILEVSLSSTLTSRKDLIVFRRPGDELRLVTVKTPIAPPNSEGMPPAPRNESQLFKMHQDHVVPRYALPSHRSIPHSRIIELCPGPRSGYSFQFNIDEDLLKFQNALLGYKVVHDRQNCKWSFHRGSFRTEKTSGVGRVQIWQAKPLPPTATAPTPTLTETDTIGPLSPVSGSPPNWSPAWQSAPKHHARTDSIHSNSTLASTVRPRPSIKETGPESGNTITMKRPVLPLLVIFTEINKKPTYLVVRLDRSIEINPSACDCATEKKRGSCTRTILECNPPKRDKFTILQHSASGSADSDLPDWNLALFSQPRHPNRDSTVDHIEKVRWLSIDTPNPVEREWFQAGFRTVGRLRDTAERKFIQQEARIRRRAEKPAVGKETEFLVPTPGHGITPSIRGSVIIAEAGLGAGLGIGLSHGSFRSAQSNRNSTFTGRSVSPTDVSGETGEGAGLGSGLSINLSPGSLRSSRSDRGSTFTARRRSVSPTDIDRERKEDKSKDFG